MTVHEEHLEPKSNLNWAMELWQPEKLSAVRISTAKDYKRRCEKDIPPWNPLFGIGFLGVGLCLMISIYVNSVSSDPLWFITYILLACTISFLLLHEILIRVVTKQRKAFLENLEFSNPLYARALLIIQAQEDWLAHYERYQHWHKMVCKGLAERDDGFAQKYFQFLTRTQTSIYLARMNLEEAVELEDRKRAFLAKNPTPQGEPTDTALSQLTAKLDKPVLAPKLRAPETKLALVHEEALAELAEDPFGEDELAAKIDALPQPTK